ncbi:hypothetical protein A0H81_10170 [Grifola frondosa]|uniref:Uncharacterized protein n=1 Tax=Grifola frondosa TaxID=5627 RepID=A0A1C7M0E3_GRIFR|nr:hypothetical protein A0H81_10170 [Grifola frondosa]
MQLTRQPSCQSRTLRLIQKSDNFNTPNVQIYSLTPRICYTTPLFRLFSPSLTQKAGESRYSQSNGYRQT